MPPTALNAFCLQQPHWRVIARGLQTERWFRDGQAVGNGGIFNPVPIDLPSGQYYFRFTSASLSLESQLGSGWWLDFEAFRTVSAFARDHEYRLRDAARLMLALPYAWREGEPSRLDRVAKLMLKSTLKAYAGYGKPAIGAQGGADRGTRWIPTQHVRVRQLYVPGLCDPIEDRKPSREPAPLIYQVAFQLPAQFSPLP